MYQNNIFYERAVENGLTFYCTGKCAFNIFGFFIHIFSLSSVILGLLALTQTLFLSYMIVGLKKVERQNI